MNSKKGGVEVSPADTNKSDMSFLFQFHVINLK